MSIKRLIVLVGLCGLFAGCSTGRYNMMGGSSANEGVRYLMGRGVPQSDAKAFAYFRYKARSDDPFAQNEVAYMYAAGKGTPRDYAKALEWYQKAADHGLESAQYNLSLMYYYGLGTPKDKTMAMQWLQKAAKHGFEPAQARLSQLRA